MILLTNAIIHIITVFKTKPTDFKFCNYAEYNVDSNCKDPKLKIGNYVRISKHKKLLAEGYAPNWSEEVFVISKIKNTAPWANVINDLNGEKIVGTFYEKELQNTSQEDSRIEKAIKRKGDKQHV